MQINLNRYQHIVILTGAGVSAASELPIYRGPDGIWQTPQAQQYGNAQTLREHPQRTWQLFGSLRAPMQAARPNPAHIALALLEAKLHPEQQFLLITQNIDGLHQRAGNKKIVELHGNLGFTRCTSCALPPFADNDAHADSVPLCPACGSPLRPDIVLFDEEPSTLASWQAKRALRDCDLFIAIGTSGIAWPACDFVRAAEYAGARTICLNLEAMKPKNPAFQEEYLGKAEDVLPHFFGLQR